MVDVAAMKYLVTWTHKNFAILVIVFEGYLMCGGVTTINIVMNVSTQCSRTLQAAVQYLQTRLAEQCSSWFSDGFIKIRIDLGKAWVVLQPPSIKLRVLLGKTSIN